MTYEELRWQVEDWIDSIRDIQESVDFYSGGESPSSIRPTVCHLGVSIRNIRLEMHDILYAIDELTSQE